MSHERASAAPEIARGLARPGGQCVAGFYSELRSAGEVPVLRIQISRVRQVLGADISSPTRARTIRADMVPETRCDTFARMGSYRIEQRNYSRPNMIDAVRKQRQKNGGVCPMIIEARAAKRLFDGVR